MNAFCANDNARLDQARYSYSYSYSYGYGPATKYMHRTLLIPHQRHTMHTKAPRKYFVLYTRHFFGFIIQTWFCLN